LASKESSSARRGDDHDRYANIEINYLLQGIEEHAGLAILAAGNRAKIENVVATVSFRYLRPASKKKRAGENLLLVRRAREFLT
jgi:hypothetical protein